MQSSHTKFYFVWVPAEMMYLMAEGRSIEEATPKAKDPFERYSNGTCTWEGIIIYRW